MEKIRQAAEEFTKRHFPSIRQIPIQSFKAGANSKEAKELHTKDMYTKEEVLSILEFVNDRLSDLYSRFDSEHELKEYKRSK